MSIMIKNGIEKYLLLASPVVIYLVAIYISMNVSVPKTSFLRSSFIVHTVMIILSLVVISLSNVLSFADCGISIKTYSFRPSILLWLLPSFVIFSCVGIVSRNTLGSTSVKEILQVVIFVWVYSSICEEVLTRGLLQGVVKIYFHGPDLLTNLRVSVVVSGIFFGCMHLILIKSMGFAAIVPCMLTTFLGMLAAYYRETTNSILPSIIVHVLYNIGGSVPLWIASRY